MQPVPVHRSRMRSASGVWLFPLPRSEPLLMRLAR